MVLRWSCTVGPTGPPDAGPCCWHSCQLWAEGRGSAAVGWASNRREESSTPHTHAPFQKKHNTHPGRGPSGPVPICCDQIVFRVSAGGERRWEGGGSQSPAWAPLLSSLSQQLSGTHTQGSPLEIKERITLTKHGWKEFMFSLSFFYLSVSASRFCLPAANEKIDDINGCPKSRSQMVSDLLSLCWQNVVNFTSVCVCVN